MSLKEASSLAPWPEPEGDVAQHELYQQLRAEVAKLDSTSVDVDWPAVEAISQRVLCELGQDLRAAAYWVHARHVLGGAPQLAEGLALMAALLNEAWLQLSPPPARLKARSGAIAWLVQRSEALLLAHSGPIEPAELARLRSATALFVAAVQARLAERAPALSGLQRALARLEAR